MLVTKCILGIYNWIQNVSEGRYLLLVTKCILGKVSIVRYKMYILGKVSIVGYKMCPR